MAKPDRKGEKVKAGWTAELGSFDSPVKAAVYSLEGDGFSKRLWAMDPSLWAADPDSQKGIRNRLGWLTAPETMASRLEELAAFGRSVRDSGFTHAVLLGTGGSSLGAEVLRKSFGRPKGFPVLKLLDSTDPAAILSVERSLDLSRTLFIVSSKSGSTIETLSLYRYFWERMKRDRPSAPGGHFIAITDPGTPLEKTGRESGFRKVFLNPSDVGGRYSVLSYFGLVPAALLGIDLEAFLRRAQERRRRSVTDRPIEENDAAFLGVILARLAQEGLDKVTVLAPPPLESFGLWVEQLLAESTGKEGRGLVPVVGERVGKPSVYGPDRLFVYLTMASSRTLGLDREVDRLKRAGHPVVRIFLKDRLDLAGEFFRWEIATVVAAALLGVNPFDEPNVVESKENTRKVLEEFQATGRFPSRTPLVEEEGIRLYGNPEMPAARTVGEAFRNFLHHCRSSDYIALMAYLEHSPVHETGLGKLRLLLRDRTKAATTLGYGPGFLHSTGQLHKGGPPNGLFLQITAEDRKDIAVPGEKYTFGTLRRAQALGDFYALAGRGRPLLEIQLGRKIGAGLKRMVKFIEGADR